MKTAEALPIKIWHEPIDGLREAWCCSCVVFHRGWVRAYGVFLMNDADGKRSWQHKDEVEAHFVAMLKRHYGGRLPALCRIENWPNVPIPAHFFPSSGAAA